MATAANVPQTGDNVYARGLFFSVRTPVFMTLQKATTQASGRTRTRTRTHTRTPQPQWFVPG